MGSFLGINNPVHRHKIQLKAMDAVLFGYRSRTNFAFFWLIFYFIIFTLARSGYFKDLALVALLSLAMFLYAMSRYQKRKAKTELTQLASQMEKLKEMEKDFEDMQTK